MENNHSFSTSFIPKKPMVPTQGNFRSRKSFDIFSFLSTFVVLVTILISVGIYFYKINLENEVKSKQNSLAVARESLEEGTLLELQIFNKRLISSNKILANHHVLSPFFELLGDLTLEDIQYTSFNGVISEKGLAVTMGGLGRDYKTVAIQSDILNSEDAKSLKDVSFSDLKLSDEKDSKGFVSFNVSFFVDKTFLAFENNLLKYKEQSSFLDNKDNTDQSQKLDIDPTKKEDSTKNQEIKQDIKNLQKNSTLEDNKLNIQ